MKDARQARGERPGQGGSAKRGGGRQGGRRPSSAARLFLAAFTPAEVRPALEAAQKKLVGRWWKPVHPEQFHLTLLFLGPVRDSALAQVRQVASSVASATPTFTAKLRGTGFFPNEGSPRVWFVKLEGDGLQALSDGLRAGMEAAGLAGTADESEMFKAHVTLARKKGASPRPPPVTLNLEFPLDRFALVKSTLTREGPAYQILDEFRLAPAPEAPAAAIPGDANPENEGA